MRIFAFLAVLIFMLLIQGCVSAAVMSIAAISTKVATDPRTISTQISDSTLELRINNALSKDKYLNKKARISVATYQGKVLLVGQVPNSELSYRAKRIAMNINGVTEVLDEIRQGKPLSLYTISSDTWITTKIISQLLISDQVKVSNVKVITENGEVFLLGLVSEYEGKVAEKIASQINGVKRIITDFNYIK